METPYLDNLIEMYEQYESKNWLMDEEKKQLIELKKIKQALRIHAVSGRSEQFVCGANRVMGEKRCERQCGQCEQLYPQTNCH